MMNPSDLEELSRKMDNIERMLKENSTNCQKMSNHIDFIERIYEYVKRPLFFFSDKFNRLSSFQKIPVEYAPHQTEPTDGR